MKITLWQQFSSNHSASFTVVGRFESPEKARLAAEEFERILQKISDWWNALPPNERRAWGEKTETAELTPPEIELHQHYKVDWPFSVNWYDWQWDRTVSPVSVIDNLVFISNPHWNIWKGPQPFDALMALFGGEVAVESDESRTHPDSTLVLHVTAAAPDETVAASIVEQVNQYIDAEIAELEYYPYNEVVASPWRAYHNGNPNPEFENTLVVQFLKRNYPEIEIAAHRDGTALSFNNLCFEDLQPGLRTLAAWLKAMGCTNIENRFSQLKAPENSKTTESNMLNTATPSQPGVNPLRSALRWLTDWLRR